MGRGVAHIGLKSSLSEPQFRTYLNGCGSKKSFGVARLSVAATITNRKLPTDNHLFKRSFQRTHASWRAFLLASLASGASPARMKPCPASS
jgi:hypothetical protein